MARLKIQNVSGYPLVVPPPVGGYLQPGEMTQEIEADLYELQRDKDFGAAITKGHLKLLRIDTDINKPDDIEIGSINQIMARLRALNALTPPMIGVDGAVLIEHPVGVMTWAVLQGGGTIINTFAITAFSKIGSVLIEVGTQAVWPSFVANYNKSITSASLTDTDGTTPLDVTLSPTSFSSTGIFQKNVYGNVVTFTLTADDGTGPKTAQVTLEWVQRVYYGVAAAGQSGEAFIKTLPNSPLSNTKVRTFTLNAVGPSDSMYFACRSAYGPATFMVDGWIGGFDLVGTYPVTNAAGVTENYDLYETAQPGLGMTTIGVS